MNVNLRKSVKFPYIVLHPFQDLMQNLSFSCIPPHYESLKKQISNNIIRKIYDQFQFLYYQNAADLDNEESNVEYEKNIQDFLFQFFKDFKFITYSIKTQNSNNNLQISDVFICAEKNFVILENISITLFNEIVNRIKNQRISIIKVIQCLKNHENIEEEEENETKEEILNFCQRFKKEIKNNDFISLTITAIAGYLIHRYFYPTDYFKDGSFFIFNDRSSYLNENKYKSELCKVLLSKGKINMNDLNDEIIDFIKSTKELTKKETAIQTFTNKDFIELKTVYSKANSTYKLVIHIDSLYIFLLEDFKDYKICQMSRELNFCKKYSYRTFVRFYGFLQKEGKNIGYIYEFMSNKSLDNFIKNIDRFSPMKAITIIIRIFQGINFFFENSLVHRDLRPSNILFDHDWIPYISDFETVRNANLESNEEEFTNDIGSSFYTAPEQDVNGFVSNSTDIYSFGLIIYFIFERKNAFNPNLLNEKNIDIPKITNVSDNIQRIYKKCVQFLPNKRIGPNEIHKFLADEISSYSYFENYLLDENDDFSQLSQFVYESFIFLFPNYNAFIENLSKFNKFYDMRTKGSSDFYMFLGQFYAGGFLLPQDYSKARKCYKISAKYNNPEAFCSLGALYSYGYGIIQNKAKAIKYYEKAADLNNHDSMYALGKFYYDGEFVEQNYTKAISYFKRAADLNNSSSLLALGNIYSEGKAVKKDYSFAREYYEKAAKLKNKNALLCLGDIYKNGCGVCKDYLKAKDLYEKASKLGSVYAIFNLGLLYEKGYGVEKDYSIAREYYEKAAFLENSHACLHLGLFYLLGQGVQIDHSKGIELIEKSALLGNLEAILFLVDHYLKIDRPKALKYCITASKFGSPEAFFMLGYIYSETDITKAIDCYLKCIELGHQDNYVYNANDNSCSTIKSFNSYYYRAFNDLGLIYFLHYNKIDQGNEYIKTAALNEYPFGQNNYGLMYQLYFNNIEESKYFFEKASRKSFALSFYNLGYIAEKNGIIDESINYYQLASEYENEKLYFHNSIHYDDLLEISKKFIICFTNLKLAEYYFSKNNIEQSKMYFTKSLNFIILMNLTVGKRFVFKYKEESNPYIFLSDLIFNFPFFFLQEQSNLDSTMKLSFMFISFVNFLQFNQTANSYGTDINNPNDFFDILMENLEYRSIFREEMQTIISLMKKIIYTPPYPILFGRIYTFKTKTSQIKDDTKTINPNNLFYEGFEC